MIEPGGRVSAVHPGRAEIERTFSVETEVVDLAWHEGRLRLLGPDGVDLVVDPGTERVLERREHGPAIGLAADGTGLWRLEPGGLVLSGVEAAGELVRLAEPVRSVRWSPAGILWALPAPRAPERPPFRWRGLAPGADPFRPGSCRPALLRIDRASGRVEVRLSIPQEPVAFAPDGDGFWIGVRDADGLERLTAISPAPRVA